MESKHRECASNRLIAGGRWTVDVSGVEPLSKQIISYTLYILVNVLMISQNIRFKPLWSRSKALSAASWLITPLISYNASERIKTWLKIYRNPHDTKILRGLYSAFLIHLAGFKLAPANWVSPIQRYVQNILFDLLSQFTVWVHISSSHRDTKILDENVNSFLDSFTASPLGTSWVPGNLCTWY